MLCASAEALSKIICCRDLPRPNPLEDSMDARVIVSRTFPQHDQRRSQHLVGCRDGTSAIARAHVVQLLAENPVKLLAPDVADQHFGVGRWLA